MYVYVDVDDVDADVDIDPHFIEAPFTLSVPLLHPYPLSTIDTDSEIPNSFTPFCKQLTLFLPAAF